MTKARILIVEDDPATSSGFESVLLSFGYTVSGIASTRDDAIRLARQELPDLVLMDIMLGDEPGGIEAANAIRSQHNTPIIFLTSFVDEDILARAKISDPFGYLLKPCHPRELFATIELALFKHAGLLQREAIEEELRRSREELGVILEGVAEGITVIDSNGKLVYANDAAARLTGYASTKEMLQVSPEQHRSGFEIRQEDGSPCDPESLPSRRAIRGERNVSATMSYINRQTGAEHWSMVNSNPVFDNGKVRLAITVFHDITERRRSEEHLRKEHTFRRAIEDSVPSGIATFDLEGVQTYVNQAFCRMVGWTEKDLVGARAPFMYWPPEETKAVSAAFKKMLDGSLVEKGFELRFQRCDGARFFVFLAITPLRNKDGSIEGWLMSATDINDRKRTQQQLEEAHSVLERRVRERTSDLAQANEELRKRDAQLSTAQQIAHLGSWEWDIRTSAVSWSEEMHHILGLPPGEFGGTFESFLEHVHPEDRAATWSHIQKAVQTSKPFDFEERILRPDGGIRVLKSQGKVVLDERGEVAKLTGVCVDLTEQKHLRERLDAAERKRFADLRRYAGSVQRAQEEERQRIARELHDDLCQRLSGMKLNVEVLADEVRSRDKPMHRRLQSFNKQCEELIADVRRISVNLRPTVLDDFGLIIALGLLTREFEKLHRVPINLETDASRMELEPQIEIALYRIAQEGLSNVAKHAQASSVTLELHKNARNVMLRIRDNGKGFNPAEVNTRKDVHSGLGLISMRERTELFGGSFTVESEQDQGTTIVITIPLTIETKNEENALAHRR